MEMKEKIRTVFKNGTGGTSMRVHGIKSVGERWLVSVSSHEFEGKSALDRQKIVRAMLAAAPSLTPEERKSIALVRTFSPAEIAGLRNERFDRKKRSGPIA
jgi:acid stress-induced BolA-like protein IbaG/YrbA